MSDSEPLGRWRWINLKEVDSAHHLVLAKAGGADGVRDSGGIESALSRPLNLANYGTPDAASLAACYAFGIAKNRSFVDGNKRTAWVVARLFIEKNGYRLEFSLMDGVEVMEGIADGRISEDELASWFRSQIAKT